MIKHEDVHARRIWWKMAAFWLFPIVWLFYWLKSMLTPPHLRAGIHVLIAETGRGKSLLAHLTSHHFMNKGMHVVSNSAFNKDVNVIKIRSYFDDYEQKKPLENCVPFFDEIQRDFNKRQNRTTDYNAVFVPFIDWLSTHRHKGCPRVYFITQSFNRLDIGLQEYIQKVHFIWDSKSASFHTWVRKKSLRPDIIPKKINYMYKKKRDIEQPDIDKYVKRGKIKYKKPKKYSILVPIKRLAEFNTYAFKTHDISAPKSKKAKESAKS